MAAETWDRELCWASPLLSTWVALVIWAGADRSHMSCHAVPWPSISSLISIRMTYARELGAAVAALGDSAALLDVQKAELTTGSLDDSGPVGASVVAKNPDCQPLEPRYNSNTVDQACNSFRRSIPLAKERNSSLTGCGGGR